MLEGQELKIDGQQKLYTIGTGPLCDIFIPFDPFIECTQFMIYPDNNYYKIIDCANLHHTMVKVDHTPCQIHNGTVVSFANEVYYIFEEVSVETQAYPLLRANKLWFKGTNIGKSEIPNSKVLDPKGDETLFSVGNRDSDFEIQDPCISKKHC